MGLAPLAHVLEWEAMGKGLPPPPADMSRRPPLSLLGSLSQGNADESAETSAQKPVTVLPIKTQIKSVVGQRPKLTVWFSHPLLK